ncbi:MAG: hypothetical protein IT210_01030 [Armatimonadetes bacterium]|nr:hypothetical protein [Armatimonadota bacterium]
MILNEDVYYRKSDPLSLISEAIDRYYEFEAAQRNRMKRDGVSAFYVQKSFVVPGETILRFPFDGILTFQQDRGLTEYGGRLHLNRQDGGCYWVRRDTPIYQRGEEETEFKGCIRRTEDLLNLIEKIKERYRHEIGEKKA